MRHRNRFTNCQIRHGSRRAERALGPLLGAVEPAVPPEGLLRKVERQIDLIPQRHGLRAKRGGRLCRLAVPSILLAVLVGFAVLLQPSAQRVLVDASGRTAAILDIRGDAATVRMVEHRVVRDNQMNWHLWGIGRPGESPVRLGAIEDAAVPVPNYRRFAEFALSLEPIGFKGNSPSGQVLELFLAKKRGFECIRTRKFLRSYGIETPDRVGIVTNVAHLTPTSETSAHADWVSDAALRKQLSELIGECAHQNRAAFRRLYDLTSHRVFGIALAVLRNRTMAEEVAQEVYVQIWRQAASFRHEQSNPMGWISSVTRNRAIDRLRSERARGFVHYSDEVPDLADDRLDPDAPLDTLVLTRALSGLRPEYRKVILLSYFRGYTQSEMSELLGLPLGTVKSWMKRGLSELREALS